MAGCSVAVVVMVGAASEPLLPKLGMDDLYASTLIATKQTNKKINNKNKTV
jgi:hypothetical protein